MMLTNIANLTFPNKVDIINTQGKQMESEQQAEYFQVKFLQNELPFVHCLLLWKADV